jgi:hypothetical protein
MQTSSLLNQTEIPGLAGVLRPNNGYTLNVALVYHDDTTKLWAEQVRDVMAGIVSEDAIQCSEFRIGDLRNERVYSDGIRALAQSDAVVIALHEGERLPGEFYLWVNLWLQMRRGLPGALVGLLGTSVDANSAANETRRYLHAVASQGGLRLFIKGRGRDPVSGEFGHDPADWDKAA